MVLVAKLLHQYTASNRTAKDHFEADTLPQLLWFQRQFASSDALCSEEATQPSFVDCLRHFLDVCESPNSPVEQLLDWYLNSENALCLERLGRIVAREGSLQLWVTRQCPGANKLMKVCTDVCFAQARTPHVAVQAGAAEPSRGWGSWNHPFSTKMSCCKRPTSVVLWAARATFQSASLV